MAEEKKLVKNEGSLPCGCYVVDYSDDTREVTPCAPCALENAAKHLSGAANALGALSISLRRQQAKSDIDGVVQRVVNP